MNSTAKRIVFVISLVLVGLFLYEFIQGGGSQEKISYSSFQRQLEQNNIQSVKFKGKQVTGTFKAPGKAPNNSSEFSLVIPPGSEDKLYSQLTERDVEITAESQEQSWWSMLLVNSIPILLIIGIWLYFIYRTRQSMGQGGMMGVGQSQAELYDEETPDVTFDDVAGYEGPKNEVQQIIEFLKNPEKFDRVGGEIPKGVMLVGPPGTGKTLTGRAIAGEAGVPFLLTSGSDFMEMFVGVGASRVRDLFERAKELAPSIIFIDEIDSVGRKRGAGVGGGHDEREQTLNQLLDELDGFEPNSGVILIAATNRPDVLDPALMRPGRFDREVTFDLPTVDEREAILEKHAEDKPLADDIDLEVTAKGTPGFSGADLKNLLNEAALLTAENNNDEIDHDTLEEARDKVMMGLRREEMAISDDEKETMAIHESGHTIVAYFTEGADPVHKVTIIPRGRALGATQQLPVEEKKMYTREDLMGRLAVMMGGRAAEEMKNTTVTNGAQDDLRRATKLARKMVLQWGMSSEMGNIAYEDGDGDVFLGEEISQSREYSEETAVKIDEEIKNILDEARRNAQQTLEENKESLDDLIDVLIERESLSADEIESLVENGEILPENGSGPDSAEEEESAEVNGSGDFGGDSNQDEETTQTTDETTETSTDDSTAPDNESSTSVESDAADESVSDADQDEDDSRQI
ncbi:MAG: ATP-dependent zinc metalloprotease FtsH [bacterium]